MTTISGDRQVMTLINVFSVDPARQQELVRLLVGATEHTMKHLPGFVSADVHRALDGRHVVNCARWESIADLEAMQRHPGAAAHMRAAAAIADGEPILCEVSEAVIVKAAGSRADRRHGA